MLYTHMLKSTRYNMLVPSCDNLHVGTDPYTDLYQHEQAHMLVRNRKYLAIYSKINTQVSDLFINVGDI